MNFTLPVSGKEVELKDYIPHGVHAKVQAALTRGIRLDVSSLNPTNEQLIAEFGTEAMETAARLKPGEYEKELARLKEEFVRRQIKLEGLSLENVEEANMLRAEGMVITLDGSKPAREALAELPEADFQDILKHIADVEGAPLGMASGGPSGK